jgi:hypothetical protein
MAFHPAKTIISIIIQDEGLLAGQTRTWTWFNAPKNAVYALSARPIDGQNNSALQNRVEIRNVRAMSTGSPETMRVSFEVHNWGTTWCDYWVIMSQIQFA